ncbi:uncharacterized protein BJ212DRAFT_1551371 [Suillus subaureus]|uniref:Uncharacterized protein n=1 Tax=Suillus subaureus TaxID=48587 RepID=A0A9P7J579_9AGAM|nr:uncharacterized protein BJ212DRAFT_1551371 [Suillus subaureus]KAG1803060.1 hypothetical protein BJ212DRAFT_1551371 [Suillus subaureus]
MFVHVNSDSVIQVTQAAIEHNEGKCDQYQIFIAENFCPDQLIFIDESAWACQNFADGGVLTVVCFFRYSILPAISLDGILHLNIQDHSYTAAIFNEFIGGFTQQYEPIPSEELCYCDGQC